MAWVVKDGRDNTEWIYQYKPERESDYGYWWLGGECIELPQGSIKKLIGRDLTWEDEPVELK